jgi:predicted ATPase
VLITSVEISNFRCFRSFSLALEGAPALIVSENGAGKTSLLAAISKALGKDRFAARQDFSDLANPIEIKLVLSDFDKQDQAVFPKELSFAAGKPTLCIGFKATWDPKEAEVEAIVGFPDHSWRVASREQRDALPVHWLQATREPAKLLQLAATKSFLPRLFAARNLGATVDAAVQDVATALGTLASAPDLKVLLDDLRDSLTDLIPGVQSNAFGVGPHNAAGGDDLLREFDLLLSHGGPSLPVGRQSNGLAQLATFVCLLQVLVAEKKALVLIDEPELSLHPQALRAVAGALRALPNQTIIATHSSNALDRADVRAVVRLSSTAGGTVAARAAKIPQAEAARLARFVNPLTAEACFARTVVLVEGYSDRVALLQLASRLNRNFDAAGIAILALDGGGAVGTFLQIFGRDGLGLSVLGICDEDKEQQWLTEIQKLDSSVIDRATMKQAGFFVCVRDLEQEFVRVLGIAGAQAVIANEGEATAFSAFCQQPAHRAVSADEQLRRFFHKHNIRWAAPLVDALDLKAIPGPLNDLLGRL